MSDIVIAFIIILVVGYFARVLDAMLMGYDSGGYFGIVITIATATGFIISAIKDNK